ncbi:pentapeptide repeat-containing protein [Actinobaculum suis]|uniref:pentapeptide repeat-containing protein n=1 Tax=Actinobaculum suis TaxID=1657 RepID=UPI00159EF01D
MPDPGRLYRPRRTTSGLPRRRTARLTGAKLTGAKLTGARLTNTPHGYLRACMPNLAANRHRFFFSAGSGALRVAALYG